MADIGGRRAKTPVLPDLPQGPGDGAAPGGAADHRRPGPDAALPASDSDGPGSWPKTDVCDGALDSQDDVTAIRT